MQNPIDRGGFSDFGPGFDPYQQGNPFGSEDGFDASYQPDSFTDSSHNISMHEGHAPGSITYDLDSGFNPEDITIDDSELHTLDSRENVNQEIKAKPKEKKGMMGKLSGFLGKNWKPMLGAAAGAALVVVGIAVVAAAAVSGVGLPVLLLAMAAGGGMAIGGGVLAAYSLDKMLEKGTGVGAPQSSSSSSGKMEGEDVEKSPGITTQIKDAGLTVFGGICGGVQSLVRTIRGEPSDKEDRIMENPDYVDVEIDYTYTDYGTPGAGLDRNVDLNDSFVLDDTYYSETDGFIPGAEYYRDDYDDDMLDSEGSKTALDKAKDFGGQVKKQGGKLWKGIKKRVSKEPSVEQDTTTPNKERFADEDWMRKVDEYNLSKGRDSLDSDDPFTDFGGRELPKPGDDT